MKLILQRNNNFKETNKIIEILSTDINNNSITYFAKNNETVIIKYSDTDEYFLINDIQSKVKFDESPEFLITIGDVDLVPIGGGAPVAPAIITGKFIGSSATYAGLPTTTVLSQPAVNGDWSILTADDGPNISGIYLYNGSSYTFVMEIADSFSQASTVISPASDNAVGAIGIGLDYARNDHKHPAQGISADAEQLLQIGTDGLHKLDPDNIISTDARNSIVKGTDSKIHAPFSSFIPFIANDPAGAIGVSTEIARADHKHPAQQVSTDAEQLLTNGTDGRAMLDPDNLVSTDGSNNLKKGTDNKLYAENEVVTSTIALSGSAPSGAQVGVNNTTGDFYYVNGSGNWTPVPVSITTNDQTPSGYFDIGNMRIQWGSTNNSSVNFPVPFLNTSYSISLTPEVNDISGTYSIQAALKLTSSVAVTRNVNNSSSINPAGFTYSWFAIGQKP